MTLKKLLESNRQVALHVTHGKYLKSILQNGLSLHSPTLGDQLDDEGVYFFPDEVTLEDAWGAWLEDLFDEDEKVYCLTVDITGLRQHVGGDYEIIVTEKVAPNRILDYKEI